MKFISKSVVAVFTLMSVVIFFAPQSYAKNTKCGDEMAMMRQIKKRFSSSNGELHYAMARGVNRKFSLWKACGYSREGKTAAAAKAKAKALKNCRKHSDKCKIIEQFRWTSKKCPSRNCFVWIPN